jgi:hypothetical protein
VESADIKISILLHVISCANSRAPERRRSFVESRESLSARASRNAKEEVLKEVPNRTTEDARGAAELFEVEAPFRLRVSEPVASKLLSSGSDIVAGCATRVDFNNRTTSSSYVI